MSIDIKLPFGPFRDALSTILGAILSFVVVSMIAGTLLTIITYWGDMSFESFIWTLFTAWIGHWIMVCVPIWGLLFAFMQFIAFHALIYSSRDPLFILGLIFINQTFISTIALLIFTQFSEYYIFRILIGSFTLLGIAGYGLWRLHREGYSRAII